MNRPENCIVLTKTCVNQRYLGFALSKYKILWQFFTATSGSAFIRSACCVVKILDTLDKIKRNVENSDNIQKCTEYGLDAVGLMAQYSMLTAKKNHRGYLSHEYHHLSSSSVPYVLISSMEIMSQKEIQDINRVGIQKCHIVIFFL